MKTIEDIENVIRELSGEEQLHLARRLLKIIWHDRGGDAAIHADPAKWDPILEEVVTGSAEGQRKSPD